VNVTRAPLTEVEEDLRFRWIGGRPALDFANTTAWGRFGGPQSEQEQPQYERFTRYARLVEFGQQAGLLGESEAVSLLAESERRPEEAELAVAQAIALRKAIHHIFASTAQGHPSDPAALAVLNASFAEGMARLRVVREQDGFSLEWMGGESVFTRPLWPVAQDTTELLISGDLSRVRECSGDPCGFLFLDRSRPGRRRWCDMADCGNRAKARRYHQRTRAARPRG
jgi:predicted RNA-binding Zn ribbon-like protein